MKTTRASLVEALPLTIQAFQLNYPHLNLIGDSWSLTLMCPWMIRPPGCQFDWSSPDLETRIGGLLGRKVVQVEAGTEELIDPEFILDDGTRINMFPGDNPHPWAMELPGVVLIGTGRE
ncbi:hypothetical protein [Arthrobacter celericrescens]|uniref:hypothetical protein n=1 Tax=Arthrobacter celericrescens TaxID=2320851 RepID=UPI000EA1738B|nr:hypothetical protein [Arthrobacter celericrescens]